MLREGHVDGPAIEIAEASSLVVAFTWTCEPEAGMASSSNIAAVKAYPHDLDMSCSSLLLL